MGLLSTPLQLSISANFLTYGLSSFTSPTPPQWEHLPSFWLALLLLNQEENNYRIVYRSILSNLLFSCSLGISIFLQFGANTVLHSGPFTPLQWVSLLRILLTALLYVKKLLLAESLSLPRSSPVWSSPPRSSSPLRVSSPAHFLTYTLLLTQDAPVLSMLVSVPTFWLGVLLDMYGLHFSRREYICPYSDLCVPPPPGLPSSPGEYPSPVSYLCATPVSGPSILSMLLSLPSFKLLLYCSHRTSLSLWE